jgi:hypothetical protein
MGGVPVRLWVGQTDEGIRVVMAVHRVIVREDSQQSAFEADLVACCPPAEDRKRPFPSGLRDVYDARMF